MGAVDRSTWRGPMARGTAVSSRVLDAGLSRTPAARRRSESATSATKQQLHTSPPNPAAEAMDIDSEIEEEEGEDDDPDDDEQVEEDNARMDDAEEDDDADEGEI